MRVAYDVGIPLKHPTGVGRYTYELARALETMGVQLERYVVALRARDVGPAAHWRLPARVVQMSWRKLNWPGIEGLVGEIDLAHGTNFVLPALRSGGGVVTIHDLSFDRPDGFAPNRRLGAMVKWSAARAGAVIVPSEVVASEVAARYRVSEERIFVTHEAVGSDFFDASPLDDDALARLGITRPYAVAVGAIQPRKNLPRLIRAWELAARSLEDWKLVLVGPSGWGPEIPEVPGVIRSGWLDDGVLHGVLAAAEIFCYPSLYEGFGLPPLEAMAAGTAVLAGDYSAAAEVLGRHALIVNRLDPTAIADGLVTMASDEPLRRRLERSGHDHARSFTWERTAEDTLRAYKFALER